MLRIGRVGLGSFWLLLALVLGNTGCSREPDNDHVTAAVKNTILGDHRLKTPIHVSMSGGIATLSGRVSGPAERMAAVEDAAHVDGVRVVVDNLEVAPDRRASSPTLEAPPISGAIRGGFAALPSAGKSGILVSSVTRVQTPTSRARGADNAVISAPDMQALPIRSISLGSRFSDFTMAIATGVSRASSARVTSTPSIAEQTTVPGGAGLTVRLLESVSSELNQAGDTFRATLASPVMVDGKTVIPAEAALEGKIVEVRRAGRFSGRSELILAISRVAYNGQTYPLRTNQLSKQGPTRDTRSAAIIGGGAGAGAIIGAILGGGKGAAIGAIIGGGAGTGVQAATRVADVQLPSETVLSFRLQSPITVTPSAVLETPTSTGSDSAPDPFSGWRPVLKRRPSNPPASPASPPLKGPPDTGSPEPQH